MYELLDFRQIQLRQREYLLKISRLLTSNLELSAVLDIILRSAVDLTEGHIGLLALVETDGQLHIKARYGVSDELLPHFQPLLELWPTRSDSEQLAPPGLEEKLSEVASATGLPLQQVVAVPLISEKELLGVIYVLRGRGLHFQANTVQLIASFADQAAIAVRNARLYQALTRDNVQLEGIINNITDGIMILDPGWKVVRMNRALSIITGWTPEEAKGHHCGAVLHLQSPRGHDFCSDRNPPPTLQKSQQVEGTIVLSSQPRRTVVITFTPLFDEQGNLLNILLDANDITRFREAEEMQSTFISVISHELKTPVALIKGYADTLRREDVTWDTDTIREGMAIIEEEADRLTHMIDDLLDASRIQAGGLRLDLEKVDVIALAKRVVEAFRTQTEAHEFVLDFPPQMPAAWADERRVYQIMSNLLNNAIKYSPGGGTIRVGGWASNYNLTIYVADQGIGIPESEQGMLFRRFYRVDSSSRRKTPGTGLGLYLSQALVEAQGGRIWVHSKPGEGSTFFFTLPLATQSHHEPTAQNSE